MGEDDDESEDEDDWTASRYHTLAIAVFVPSVHSVANVVCRAVPLAHPGLLRVLRVLCVEWRCRAVA